jgi:hypothetical protein
METVSFEVGDQPKVKISSIGGDLRLSGREGKQFEAKAPTGAELVGEQKKDFIEITCSSDCLIFLPREAQVEGETVGGDIRATNITGGLVVRTAGGDVGLRGVGQVVFETIGGDLQARKGTGDLSVDRLGGDVFIDRISGDVRLRSVGGDLSLRRVDGLAEAVVGGDAALVFTTLGGEKISVSAGGDLSCRLPENASARVQISAGGDVHFTKTSVEEVVSEGKSFLKFGEGETEIQLNAGGDIWVGGMEGSEDLDLTSLGASIAAQVESEIEAGMAEMEASLEALGSGLGVFDSEKIGEQVRRAVNRAHRKADRAMKRADYARRSALRKADRALKKADYAQRRASSGRSFTVKFDSARAGKGKRAISDEERLSILRMLEKGTITVDEAEKLLQTLEGEL